MFCNIYKNILIRDTWKVMIDNSNYRMYALILYMNNLTKEKKLLLI